MYLTLILSAVIIVLLIAVIIFYARIITLGRIDRALRKGINKERSAATEMLRSSREMIAHPEREKEFLPTFIKFVVKTLKVDGGAVLLCGDDNYLYGCVSSGIFPPIRETSSDNLGPAAGDGEDPIRGLKTGLHADELEKICAGKGFAIYENETLPWFPLDFSAITPHLILVPIKLRNSIYGCIAIVSKTTPLVNSDGYFMIRLAEMMSLELEVIKAAQFRHDYELRLQEAREEGMSQVTTGIIHNIGNAITIAKLTAAGLKEKLNLGAEDRPERLILNEMLPNLEQHLKTGTLQQFLTENPIGRQYLPMIRDLMQCMDHNSKEALDLVNSISAKLFHISEIIELQQRFMGELGTENMVQLSNMIDASILIFEESFNKRNVTIRKDLNRELPEILIDPSVIMQVFINMFKNAVEAISEENIPGKKYELFLSLKKEVRDGKNYAVTTIRDNGPGVPHELREKIFWFGFSTKKNDGSAAHGVGLHFCSNSIYKYGGRIELVTPPDGGAEFRILLPLPEHHPMVQKN